MDALNPWFAFALAALTTSRITHFIAEEDGSVDLVLKLRSTLVTNLLRTPMGCFPCLTLWIAMPFVFAVARSTS